MYAIINCGGKQHRVEEGSVINIDKVSLNKGDSVIFNEVLFIGDSSQTMTGTPFVKGASVEGEILEQGKGKKVVVYKMKAKKRYRRKKGHRSLFTKVLIKKINIAG